MSTLIILTVQTKGLAIIVILLLLLGASIIAYLTSWLHYKSIYVKRINIIQSEKDELEKQIDILTTDNDNLKKSLLEKDKEIEDLTKRLKP
jgi:SMC interacting uncharacterized protein involved in chromosome segregation